jgi:hypothetical protein
MGGWGYAHTYNYIFRIGAIVSPQKFINFLQNCFARLYLGDAVHILLWLVALLVAIFAEDLPFTSITQGALGLASILAIMELCLVLKSRPPTNITRPIIKR